MLIARLIIPNLFNSEYLLVTAEEHRPCQPVHRGLGQPYNQPGDQVGDRRRRGIGGRNDADVRFQRHRIAGRRLGARNESFTPHGCILCTAAQPLATMDAATEISLPTTAALKTTRETSSSSTTSRRSSAHNYLIATEHDHHPNKV